jgi:hypothetical protein
LQARVVAAWQCPGHCLCGRRKWAEYRVLFGEIVHTASKAADGPFLGEPVEGDIDRLTAADL